MAASGGKSALRVCVCVCVSKGKVLIGFAIISISVVVVLELTVVVLAYFATHPQTSSGAYNASSIRVGFGSGAETTTANSQSDWSEIT